MFLIFTTQLYSCLFNYVAIFSYIDKREVLQQEYSQPPILPSPHFRWVVNDNINIHPVFFSERCSDYLHELSYACRPDYGLFTQEDRHFTPTWDRVILNKTGLRLSRLQKAFTFSSFIELQVRGHVKIK